MPKLHELQTDFRRFLTGEVPVRLLGLVDGVGFEPEARQSIYRNNLLLTLTEVLKATFPVVCRLVDDRFFEYAANVFIQRNPPVHPCLAEYGVDFADFLAGFPPAGSLNYLPDVARLEWAVSRVLGAPCPEPSVPVASLLAAQGDPAQIRLQTRAAVAYVTSAYPIDRIWRLNQPGVGATDIVLGQAGVHLEIRGADGLRVSDLPAAVWTFRSRIAGGATIGVAAAEALAIAPEFDLAAALAALFSADLVWGLL
jgi:Putative DNA-binding domain